MDKNPIILILSPHMHRLLIERGLIEAPPNVGVRISQPMNGMTADMIAHDEMFVAKKDFIPNPRRQQSHPRKFTKGMK